MKNIIIIYFVLLNCSCGKDENQTDQQGPHILKSSGENHFLPELKIKKISNIKIVFEDAQAKKTFRSDVEYKPTKDFLRKKLIFQSLNKFKNRETISESINHKEFDLYNIDLFSTENNIINKILVPNTNNLFARGSLYFNLNLSFYNLKYIKEIKSIKLMVQAISKENWTKIDLGYVKLKKFGDDNERLQASHSNQVNPRHSYKLSLENIDQNILRKLLIGDYQLGISIFDLDFKIDSNMTLQYQKFIKSFYSQKDYLYIINGESINRFNKLSRDELYPSLKKYDSGLEVSENKQIQYLNNIESYLKKNSTYNQIKEEKPNKGIWKISYPEDQSSNAILYVESNLINKLESTSDRSLYQADHFQDLQLFNIDHKYILITSQGIFHKQMFRNEQIHQFSKINKPVICERYVRGRDFKRECIHRNLNCTFLRRVKSGEEKKIYTAKEFVDSYRFDRKNKIIKQWYSEKLKTHFTIIRLFNESFQLSKNELNPIQNKAFGVYQFLDCPSRAFSGFRLDNQIFPAVSINVNRRSTISLKVETLSEDY